MKNTDYGSITGPGEVRFIRILPGAIERVWDFLTDPVKRGKWFAGGPMELRPGGRVCLKFHHKQLAGPNEQPPEAYKAVHDPGIESEATVTQCVPPRLLSFTWPGEEGVPPSEVSFELSPEGADTRLVLTHRRLCNRAEEADVSSGWHLHLTFLHALVAGTQPPLFWETHRVLEREYRLRYKI